ncbi:MAG: hypothetical protein V3V16_05305 [Melioribacteraceae bacterium]
MTNSKHLIYLFLSSLLILSCAKNETHFQSGEEKNVAILDEVQIIQIPLTGEVANRKSEISGLCWYNHNLVLLPQFPDRFSNSDGGKIFYISKEKIKNFFSGKDKSPILTNHYSINVNDFSDLFSVGSGFESITINNDIAYFTIEHTSLLTTESLMISGLIDDSLKTITLDGESLTKIPSDVNINNFSCESILFHNNQIYPIYEANGQNINPNSKVAVFDPNIKLQKEIKFPNIEYRITDVTSVDTNNTFWAINYLFPREIGKLNPASDDIAQKFGIGKSHSESKAVERLVQFQIENDKIIRTSKAPIYLELLKNDSRNWEGIARFDDDGFLIATDMFPKTILAFVKN